MKDSCPLNLKSALLLINHPLAAEHLVQVATRIHLNALLNCNSCVYVLGEKESNTVIKKTVR